MIFECSMHTALYKIESRVQFKALDKTSAGFNPLSVITRSEIAFVRMVVKCETL